MCSTRTIYVLAHFVAAILVHLLVPLQTLHLTGSQQNLLLLLLLLCSRHRYLDQLCPKIDLSAKFRRETKQNRYENPNSNTIFQSLKIFVLSTERNYIMPSRMTFSSVRTFLLSVFSTNDNTECQTQPMCFIFIRPYVPFLIESNFSKLLLLKLFCDAINPHK